jgi:hypothetical protein
MIEGVIWGALTLLITVGVGGVVVMHDRRTRREAEELDTLSEVAERVEALGDVEARIASLDARLAEAAQRRAPGGDQ